MCFYANFRKYTINIAEAYYNADLRYRSTVLKLKSVIYQWGDHIIGGITMRLTSIACIRNEVNELVGLRLMDIKTMTFKDLRVSEIKSYLKRGNVEITNVGLKNGQLVGINGSLNRLTDIRVDEVIKNNEIVILYKNSNGQYTVSDYMGNVIYNVSEQELIKYARVKGIANGKVVSRQDGSEYISAIKGSYAIKKDRINEYIDKMKKSGVKVDIYVDVREKQICLTDVSKNVREIVIPDFITRIEHETFENCTELENIILSKNLEYIGEGAFANCSKLERVDIPNKVVEIGEEAFEDCKSLKEVKFGKGVQIIYRGAFAGCESLEYVKLPESITTVWRYTFANCTSLRSVYIPNSLEMIREGAFEGCSKDLEIHVDAELEKDLALVLRSNSDIKGSVDLSTFKRYLIGDM